ncbi:MAG TPA: helix-turn-helix transcriptional regulator, partial [Gammaproteobacteria bacterium]|nr:helix-turn-helix transcriptional regulator [Gammaproteobacteria bacterium]
MSNDLARARSSYARRAWQEAFDGFSRADERRRLGPDDLERLAWSAALVGRDADFLRALERLHHACAEANESSRAARAAFWIGFHLSSLGSAAQATGWLARAERLVEREPACAERGYLLLPA